MRTSYSQSVSSTTRNRDSRLCPEPGCYFALLELLHNGIMSSDSGNGGQPPLSQQIIGAIFFILPVAIVGIFLFWCWRRYHQRYQGALDLSVRTPQSISLASLPELHSVNIQHEDRGVKVHWSDMKVRRRHTVCSWDSEFNVTQLREPVFASFVTKSPFEQLESSSRSSVQVGVLIRMPSRGTINTSEYTHLRSVVLLGSTNSLPLLD